MTNNRFYFIASIPLSMAITFGIFLVMTLLVAGDGALKLDEEYRRPLVIFSELSPAPPERTKREIVKPPEVEPIPPVPIPIQTNKGPDLHAIPIPRANPAGYKPETLGLGALSEGEYMPLVRVTPIYPRRANERGIEGYVTVALTVAADGTVPPESITIIEADPKGYFERAAIAAAQKFKYKPKVVNGKAISVSGVTYRFSFTLEE